MSLRNWDNQNLDRDFQWFPYYADGDGRSFTGRELINESEGPMVSNTEIFGNCSAFDYWAVDKTKKPYTILVDGKKGDFIQDFKNKIDFSDTPFYESDISASECCLNYIKSGNVQYLEELKSLCETLLARSN